MNDMNKLRAVMVFAALVVLTTGCGRKTWPEPNANIDKVRLVKVQGRQDNRCLSVYAVVGGAVQNLYSLVLEIAPVDEENCPTCPFSPRQRYEYFPDSPEVKVRGRSIFLNHCPLSPEVTYRWRLVLKNRYGRLSDETSAVFMTR